MYRPRFEPSTFPVQVQSITAMQIFVFCHCVEIPRATWVSEAHNTPFFSVEMSRVVSEEAPVV